MVYCILHACLKWASKVKKPYSQTWNCIKNSISYFAKLIWLKNLIFQQSVTVRHFLQYQPIYCHQPLLASVPLFQSDQLWPILLSLQRDLCLYCRLFICQDCQACTLIKVCKWCIQKYYTVEWAKNMKKIQFSMMVKNLVGV